MKGQSKKTVSIISALKTQITYISQQVPLMEVTLTKYLRVWQKTICKYKLRLKLMGNQDLKVSMIMRNKRRQLRFWNSKGKIVEIRKNVVEETEKNKYPYFRNKQKHIFKQFKN